MRDIPASEVVETAQRVMATASAGAVNLEPLTDLRPYRAVTTTDLTATETHLNARGDM